MCSQLNSRRSRSAARDCRRPVFLGRTVRGFSRAGVSHGRTFLPSGGRFRLSDRRVRRVREPRESTRRDRLRLAGRDPAGRAIVAPPARGGRAPPPASTRENGSGLINNTMVFYDIPNFSKFFPSVPKQTNKNEEKNSSSSL